MSRRAFMLALVAVVALAGVGVRAGAQHVHAPAVTAPPAPAPGAGAPRRVSEAELHANQGVPRGWKFGVEPGEASRGRDLFAELECYKCHEVANGKFPVPGDGKYTGPELTGMGRMHPAEYIAESILFPNNVIVDEPGHTGPDGRSVMPSYADSLTVTQWLDLVAYLKSLTEGGEHPVGHGVERVTTAGDYRIRVVYADGGHDAPGASGTLGGHAGHGAPAGHHGMAAHAPRARGHLMAFITDRETGETVPYLPVTVTAQGTGLGRRTVTLRPMVSDDGFHYGADVTLLERTEKLTLAIGATTMRVAASARGRFSKPVTAVVDWGAAAR